MAPGLLAGAAERLVVPGGGLFPIHLLLRGLRPPSAEAAGHLFIHGFPQEVFVKLQARLLPAPSPPLTSPLACF